MGYNFGGDTGVTPDQLKRRRDIARAMMNRQGTPQNVGQGLEQASSQIAGALLARQADKRERAARDAATSEFDATPWGGQSSPITSTRNGSVATALLGRESRNAALEEHGGPTRAAAAEMNGLPPSIVQSESGGNWNALNSEGYGGRGQFGTERLADAARAGVIPPGMTGEQYSQAPKPVQLAVENWHRGDIMNNLGQYVGRDVDGDGPIPPLTEDSILAVAHLGGTGGAQKFIETGGRYNPSDSNGTSLADYATRHAGGVSTQGTQVAQNGGIAELPPEYQYSGPSVQQIQQVLSNPWLNDQQRAQAEAALARAQKAEDPAEQLRLRLAYDEAVRERSAPQERDTQYVEGVGLIDKQTGEILQRYPETGESEYSMLSEEEAQRMGLPEGNYQRGPDGRIAPISGGGQNITVNTGEGERDRYIYGTDAGLPNGWRLDRQTGEASRIPGGPAAVEQQELDAASGRKEDQQQLKLGTTLSSINLNIGEIENGGLPVTGAWGDFRRTYLGRVLTGDDAMDFGNRTDQVTDSAAFSEIQRMRDNSPTGGAVGQLTDGERKAIGNAVTALNNSTSSEEYLRAAKAYRQLALDLAYGEGSWTLGSDGSVQIGEGQVGPSDDELLKMYGG